MEKQWFVVHTLSGQEGKVERFVKKRIDIEEMSEYIGEVLIPMEKVSEVKQGKKSESTRKFFPGYVLVNVALYDEDNNLNERTWYFIQDIPGIIKFVGGERPVPLPQHEVDSIMNQIQEKQERATPKVDFEIGETVKITDGAFMNFNGTIEKIDPDRGKLEVAVSIFGRSAPVELEYWQIEKVVE
jgi:transcription termination/antitermination protein NusG